MTSINTSLLDPEILDQSYTYDQYRELCAELLDEEKTTGENHSEDMLHHSRMNLLRMERLDRQVELTADLKNRLKQLDRDLIWLVFTEGWCGDAAQNLPVIHKMADATDKIELKLFLRDRHPELMNRFLTAHWSRSIPKLACLDAQTLDLLGTWGPRPHGAQEQFLDDRNRTDLSVQEAVENLYNWYSDDQNVEIQGEFLYLLEEWDP